MLLAFGGHAKSVNVEINEQGQRIMKGEKNGTFRVTPPAESRVS